MANVINEFLKGKILDATKNEVQRSDVYLPFSDQRIRHHRELSHSCHQTTKDVDVVTNGKSADYQKHTVRCII